MTSEFKRRVARAACIIAALVMAVLVWTWPLALHLKEAIPAGSEPEAVALFQLFSMQWTGISLQEGLSYWDAPFFYPFKGTFAWCEPQPFTACLVWLISRACGYILAYNLVLLAYLVALGAAGYYFCRLLSCDRVASFWCALWLSVGPYSMQQICAPALAAAAFPVTCLIFLFLYLRHKKRRFIWAATAALLLTWFTCKQTAFNLLFLLPFTLAFFLPRSRPGSWDYRTLLSSLFFFLICILPMSLWQLRHTGAMGFSRRISDVTASLSPYYLFMPAKGHWLAGRILGLDIYSWDIGISAVLMIAVAAGLGLLGFLHKDAFRSKALSGLLLMAVVALFLGFGPAMGVIVDGKRVGLYRLLFDFFPGFSFIRAPARFAFFTIMAFSVIASFSFSYLRKRFSHTFVRLALTLTFFGLLVAETWVSPLNLVFPGLALHSHAGVDRWLGIYGGGRPLLELPSPPQLWPIAVNYEAEAMLRALSHRNPLVNGYASFAPASYYQLRLALQTDPLGKGRRYLQAYGIRLVLVHKHRIESDAPASFIGALGNDIVYEDKGHTIYLLPQTAACLDAREAIPKAADFRKALQQGDYYSLTLPTMRQQAILLKPQDEPSFICSWKGDSGRRRQKKVRLRGAVLVDPGQGRLYFELNGFSLLGRDAYARLISFEEMEELLRPRLKEHGK